ncbi:hypothetical protein BGX23_006413, partial [Mortierella sp. AD031]
SVHLQSKEQLEHQLRACKSQGSLREVCRTASRMASRSHGDIISRHRDMEADETVLRSKSVAELRSLPQLVGWNGNEPNEDLEAAIELKQLVASSRDGGGGVGVGGHGHDTVDSMVDTNYDGLGGSGSLVSPFSSQVEERPTQQQQQQLNQHQQGQQGVRDGGGGHKQRKLIKMRGRQEYEPGPLLAMNFLIVFPGDSGSRKVCQQGRPLPSGGANEVGKIEEMDMRDEGGRGGDREGEEEKDENGDTLYNNRDGEKRLPPMAIGTVFVPDPVRWWAYKAKQQLDRQKFERELRKMHSKHSKSKDKQYQYQQHLNKTTSATQAKSRRAS